MQEDAKKISSLTPEKPSQNVSPSTVSIDEFNKVDLRIAQVLEAEAVEGSDKLLKLIVQIGDVKKQIFSGIRQHYTPEELIGKHLLIVANLEPRKMRFGVSEGMILTPPIPMENYVFYLPTNP